MSYKIAFFGAKPYDIASFDKVNESTLRGTLIRITLS